MSDKEEVLKYELVEVPTNFGTAVQTPEKEVLTVEQAIVELLNKVDYIYKKM